MKRLIVLLMILISGLFCLVDFAGCQSEGGPAPMTPEVVRAGVHAHIDEQTLRKGRILFVSRCIECHTLPVVAHHSPTAWPYIVDHMAKRADLKPAEREAIVAYVLAVRAQTK
jgi:hypothetical protein